MGPYGASGDPGAEADDIISIRGYTGDKGEIGDDGRQGDQGRK